MGRANRKRRPLLAMTFALLGVAALGLAGLGIYGQLQPRKFTVAQQRRIEAWEMARRWRTTPKAQIFPVAVGYQLAGAQLASVGGLKLRARRLEIAPQASCAKAAGARPSLMTLLARNGCQALLRATYLDASSSLVLTVGIAVLRDQASATVAANYLTGGVADGQGALSHQLVLHPVQVAGTPAAAFGVRQRQLSWVIGAGPYLVMATVGYADGRPHVRVSGDSYSYLEMTNLARGVATVIAAPLAAPPPVPRCPGALASC